MMSTISKEDVKGIEIEGEGHVCAECATDDEFDGANLDAILTGPDLEEAAGRADTLYFCDRCKARIA